MSFLCVVSASDCVSDVGPASVIVGNLVQGNRLASAQGRDVGGGTMEEESDSNKKVSTKINSQSCNNLLLYMNILLATIYCRNPSMARSKHP